MATGSRRRVVYLVRHGRTALNADGRIRGHLDPPLDEMGQRDAAELAEAFANLSERPVRIVSGPLTRTRETAAPIASCCGLETEIDTRLVDRDYGPWAGEPTDELRARFGADLAQLPDAETLHTVIGRAQAVLYDQVRRLPDGPIILISHDIVIRLLLCHIDPALGPPHALEQRTGAWNALELTSTGWRVELANEDAHSLRHTPDPGRPPRPEEHT